MHVLRALEAQGIVGGYDLSEHYPQLGQALLVCATETRTPEDIAQYAFHLERIVSKRRLDPPCAVKVTPKRLTQGGMTMAQIKLSGTPINTNGDLPKVGSKAPDFHLTAADLSDVTLATYKGKTKLLNIVPSLDTPTCALSTKKFNEHAAKYGNAVMLIVSADLPFAQKRFCTAEHTDRVVTVSMMRDKNFAKDYGVLIQDGRSRASPRAPWWCSTRTTWSSTPSSCPRSRRSRTTMPRWRH